MKSKQKIVLGGKIKLKEDLAQENYRHGRELINSQSDWVGKGTKRFYF